MIHTATLEKASISSTKEAPALAQGKLIPQFEKLDTTNNYEEIHGYLQKKEFSKAIAASKEALAIDEKNIQMLVLFGRIYLERAIHEVEFTPSLDDFRRAIKQFKKAIALDRNHIDAHFYLAKLYNIVGKNKLASNLFTKVLTLDKTHQGALKARAHTYLALQKFDLAYQDFEKYKKLTS